MASKWYPLGFRQMLENNYDFEHATNIKFALTTTTYNAAHDFYDDVSASTVGTPIALTSADVTATGTVFTYDAADTGLTWNSVAAGSTITAVICYYDTGVASTSPLIAFLDCNDTPTNGGNITVTIHASGIGTIEFA